jgi:hypothetical protein
MIGNAVLHRSKGGFRNRVAGYDADDGLAVARNTATNDLGRA